MSCLLRRMTHFSKQSPRQLLHMLDSVLEEYGLICIVDMELTAGMQCLPRKSGKRGKNEKVGVTEHFFLPEP